MMGDIVQCYTASSCFPGLVHSCDKTTVSSYYYYYHVIWDTLVRLIHYALKQLSVLDSIPQVFSTSSIVCRRGWP